MMVQESRPENFTQHGAILSTYGIFNTLRGFLSGCSKDMSKIEKGGKKL